MLQLRRRLDDQILVFGELIIIVQTVWICKGTRRFYDLSRHDLFDRQFHFLQIHRSLWNCQHMQQSTDTGLLQLTGISGVSNTYLGMYRGPYSFLIASLTALTSLGVNFFPGFINKKSITLSSSSCGRLCPTHIESAISSGQLCVNNGVYLAASKPHPTRIQYSVSTS